MQLAKVSNKSSDSRLPQGKDELTYSIPIQLLLGCLALAALLPVLIWPHWGMLSDAVQIIQTGRIFWSDPAHNLDLVRGYWRPGFHICDLLTWAICQESPLPFYLFRSMFFVATVCLTYRACFSLSRSQWISTLTSSLWLLAAPTAEVIYTLDKGETYLAFVFASILCLWLSALKHGQPDGSRVPPKLLCCIWLLSTWAMFTKETAQILVVFSGINFLFTVLLKWIKRDHSQRQSQWRSDASLQFLAITVSSLVLYKCYFYLAGGIKAHSYMPLNFSAHTIWANLSYYKSPLCDLFLGWSFCALTLLFEFRTWLANKGVDSRLACSLVGTTFIAGLVFLSLPVPLVYVWFPLYAFVLPALAYSLARLVQRIPFNWKFAMPVVLAPVVLFSVSLVPLRAYQSQYQFQLDALAQDLTGMLADYAHTNELHEQKLVLFLHHADQTEIGERLEFFTFDKMSRLNGAAKQDLPYEFANFLRYDPPCQEGKAASPEPIILGRQIKLDDGAKASRIGLKTYSYDADSRLWKKRDLVPGTLILVPFGNLPDKLSSYRAAGLFRNTWEQKRGAIPQVRCSEVLTVSRDIVMSKGRKSTIGWKLVKVESISDLSWNMDETGFLELPTPVFLKPSIRGRTLLLQFEGAAPTKVLLRQGEKESVAEVHPDGSVSIPITDLRAGSFTLSEVNSELPRKFRVSGAWVR